MNYLTSFSIVFITLFSFNTIAEDSSLFSKGVKAKNVHHIGDVWLSHLSHADDYYGYNIAVATFAPGARLDWHIHPKGQQLVITEGVGFYQEWNMPVKIVQKGDVIKCTPKVAHWHSASPDSSVTYLAITGNESTQWLEPVSDSVYNNVVFTKSK